MNTSVANAVLNKWASGLAVENVAGLNKTAVVRMLVSQPGGMEAKVDDIVEEFKRLTKQSCHPTSISNQRTWYRNSQKAVVQNKVEPVAVLQNKVEPVAVVQNKLDFLKIKESLGKVKKLADEVGGVDNLSDLLVLLREVI